jgi:uncharacterized protein YecE (DUF72 family)
MIADILGDRMGCFLFQLPPSYRYTKVRLNDIVSQLDPARRNVVEFRHASWWNEEVYSAFRKAGIIFCSCSAPRLPNELIRTADEVYVRLHGPKRWYRHDYSNEELGDWATKIKDSGAKRAWVYFNNDFDAHAPENAVGLRRMLRSRRPSLKLSPSSSCLAQPKCSDVAAHTDPRLTIGHSTLICRGRPAEPDSASSSISAAIEPISK